MNQHLQGMIYRWILCLLHNLQITERNVHPSHAVIFTTPINWFVSRVYNNFDIHLWLLLSVVKNEQAGIVGVFFGFSLRISSSTLWSFIVHCLAELIGTLWILVSFPVSKHINKNQIKTHYYQGLYLLWCHFHSEYNFHQHQHRTSHQQWTADVSKHLWIIIAELISINDRKTVVYSCPQVGQFQI